MSEQSVIETTPQRKLALWRVDFKVVRRLVAVVEAEDYEGARAAAAALPAVALVVTKEQVESAWCEQDVPILVSYTPRGKVLQYVLPQTRHFTREEVERCLALSAIAGEVEESWEGVRHWRFCVRLRIAPRANWLSAIQERLDEHWQAQPLRYGTPTLLAAPEPPQ